MQNEIANYSKSEAKRELARLSLLLKRANQAYHRDDDPIMTDSGQTYPAQQWSVALFPFGTSSYLQPRGNFSPVQKNCCNH